ncbi:MAG: hypothetical protein KJ970_18580 [Candidatus Eisenbacteria bacterium]|uniref:Uncharacterized protein n=1 Tax=Eiseniibacteriota bacterium TaxID=2212470 RepID=A0A948RXN0_UNCEI|nr:hypothetical protein [Candidatus Eisenbacteria bacterium]
MAPEPLLDAEMEVSGDDFQILDESLPICFHNVFPDLLSPGVEDDKGAAGCMNV